MLIFLLHKKLFFETIHIKTTKYLKNFFYLKKKLSKSRNIKKILSDKKKKLVNLFDIKFDYLELRNISNLRISNKAKNSKLFVAYYIDKVRLIDNF